MSFLSQHITYCPVPIGVHAIVIAFIPQRVFKGLDVKSVPWEEVARSVNLNEKSVTQGH